jgi:hypothetical protein
MKIKTGQLTGAELDWAVAKCWYGDEYDMSIPLFEGGKLFAPSINWAQGGPIIEGECIDLYQSGIWSAEMVKGEDVIHTEGPTPLIAAMRCYVASKFGDEVNFSDQLTETV